MYFKTMKHFQKVSEIALRKNIGVHYESLIDSVKICTAFENYNKAMLLKNGYLVHQISSKTNRALAERQKNEPILINEFLISNKFKSDDQTGRLHLDVLQNFKTISFNLTLKDSYQSIISLDREFHHFLNGMNNRRNRLHFYKNAYGVFNLTTLLKTLSFAKEYGTKQIENQLDALKGVDIY